MSATRMQTKALWSDTVIQPSTSSSETENTYDVICSELVDQQSELVRHGSKTESRRSSTNIIAQPRLFHPVIFALFCLLLVVASDAKPVHNQPNQLQDSLIYSSLVRSVSDTPAVVLVRTRRSSSSSSTPTEDELLALAEKKSSYPRICYFSPIQCLFSSSPNLNERRRR